MADLDVQSVSLVSSILYPCPLLPPDIDVLPFIVLSVLPLTEAILSNRPGGDDDVDMGVILGGIIAAAAPVDSGNRAQITGQEIALDEFENDPNQFTRRQLVGQGSDKLPCCAGIPAHLRLFDLVAEMLEFPELWRRVVRQNNLLPKNILPRVVVRSIFIAVVQRSSADVAD